MESQSDIHTDRFIEDPPTLANTCSTIRPLVVIRILVILVRPFVLDEAAAPELMTVQAHKEAAHGADPVMVEQGGLAHVAHLAHPLDGPLPRNGLVGRGQVLVHAFALLGIVRKFVVSEHNILLLQS